MNRIELLNKSNWYDVDGVVCSEVEPEFYQ